MEYSVDELAERSGTTVRTIRYYQSEGLLPTPQRRGREVRYGDDHVARLAAISDLQASGLRLSAISELLARTGHTIPAGAPIDDWLDLGRAVGSRWSDDSPALLTHDEVVARVDASGAKVDLDGLIAAGLLERRDDTAPVVYFAPSSGLLDVALQVLSLGIDPALVGELHDRLRARLRDLAVELVEEFTDRFSLDVLAERGPAALARLLDELQPVTRRAMELLFAQEMQRAQHELVERTLTDAEEQP